MDNKALITKRAMGERSDGAYALKLLKFDGDSVRRREGSPYDDQGR